MAPKPKQSEKETTVLNPEASSYKGKGKFAQTTADPGRNRRVKMSTMRPMFTHWCECVPSRFSRVQLFLTPWNVARQAPLSMGFSRQEYWSGLPYPPSEDLPDPGIEPPTFYVSCIAGRFFTAEPPGKPIEITGSWLILKELGNHCWSLSI